MSYRYLFAISVSSLFLQAPAQDFPEWNNTEVVQVNRENPHAKYSIPAKPLHFKFLISPLEPGEKYWELYR